MAAYFMPILGAILRNGTLGPQISVLGDFFGQNRVQWVNWPLKTLVLNYLLEKVLHLPYSSDHFSQHD